MARAVTWTYDKVMNLIELFRSRPFLWDTSHAEFKDGEKKIEAYDEIAREMSITRKDVEAKLHTLRSQFTRERKRIALTVRHGVTDGQKTWMYYEPMQFLLRAKNCSDSDVNRTGESSLCQSDMGTAFYMDDSSPRLTLKEESDNTSESFLYEFKAEEIDVPYEEENNNTEDTEQEHDDELGNYPFAANFADFRSIDENPRNEMAYSWTHNKVIRLIELLRSKPVLWDASIKNYRSKPKRIEAFEEIARVLKITRKNVEAKVHGLRTQFVKERQKIAVKLRSGMPMEKIVKWVFYEPLKFLYAAPRNKFDISNIMVDNNSFQNHLRNNIGVDESTSVGIPPNASTSTVAKKRRKPELPISRREIEEISWNTRMENTTNGTEEDFLLNRRDTEELAGSTECDDEGKDYADKKIKKNLDEMDPCDIYGAYVASELRSVNDAQAVTHAKHLINNILYQIKMDHFKSKNINADE